MAPPTPTNTELHEPATLPAAVPVAPPVAVGVGMLPALPHVPLPAALRLPAERTGPLRITDMAPDDRPRERLAKAGPSALSNAELLAILINTGLPKLTAIDMARAMLNSVGDSLDALGKNSVSMLMRQKGIGEAKAITIAAALELGRRRKAEQERITTPLKLSDPQSIYIHFRHLFLEKPHEEFHVAYFNQGLGLISTRLIGVGGITATVADPKIVFKYALELQATALVLMHNHPSGGTTPSPADDQLTRKIAEGAKLFDMRLIDHLIFTDIAFGSYSDMGRL